jgi:uncharacterized protein (DUF885 family)
MVKGTPPNVTTTLDAVIDGYLELRWQLDPVAASAAGAHAHDARWADRSPAGVRLLEAALRSYAGSLEEEEAETLEDEIDRTAALHSARSDLEQLGRWRPYARDPGWHLRHLLDGLYVLLLTLPHDPPARTAAILARLRGAPAFLEMAVESLTDPAPIHVETARAMLAGAMELVRTGIAEAPLDPDSLEPGALDEAVAACVDALLGFGDWLHLTSDTATGSFAVGRGLYDSMLHTAHMIQTGADELARYGEQLREEAERELARVAEEIAPGTPWRELAAQLDDEGPPPDPLAFLDEEIRSARGFVEERQVVSLTSAPLVVEETPAYLLPLVPLAAYVPAGALENDQTGHFLVSSDAAESGQGRTAADLAVIAVHEAIPGHHTHMSTSNGLARPARRLLFSPVMVEGWALYAESLLAELGFFADVRRRFAQLRLLRWRAIRIEIDVGLHTRGLSPDDAVARLRDDVGLSPEAALAEIRRQCAMPTYAASYAAGRREILLLREAERARAGAAFSLRTFHDELLGYGRLPVALARWGMGLA